MRVCVNIDLLRVGKPYGSVFFKIFLLRWITTWKNLSGCTHSDRADQGPGLIRERGERLPALGLLAVFAMGLAFTGFIVS